MRKLTLAAFGALSLVASYAQPLWMRDVKVSPDGTTIAFRYGGDIFTVPVTGGEARRLTADTAQDRAPIWSPDSKQIAFASDRDGAFNIYIMDANGANLRKLTNGSASLTPEAFSPDGTVIIYSGSLQDPASSLLFPTTRLPELYSIPVNGGASKQILASTAHSVSYLADGKSFIYQDRKGQEDVWRKHHTSSVTRDVWLYDANTGKHTNLTNIGGENLNPVMGQDGKTVYFLSERNGGSMNVYAMQLDNPKEIKPISNFTTHPVRFLSQSADGTLVYTYNGEIYAQRIGAAPTKVNIAITADMADRPHMMNINRFSEGVASPDGTEVAIVSRGNVFVTAADYSTTKQVSQTPAMEKGVSWHPNGRKLAYTSDRSGHWDIYQAAVERADDPNFSNATIITETLLPGSDGRDRTSVQYSPDGKKIAFVSDRNKIMVMNADGSDLKQLTDGSGEAYRDGDIEYSWSPDSRWIATQIVDNGHLPYSDIAIINTETGELHNITGTGYFDQSPVWAMDGNAVLFYTDRFGMRNHASWGSQGDVMAAFLNQEAYDRFRLGEEDFKLLKDAEKVAKEKAEKSEKADKEKKGDKKDVKKSEKESDNTKTIKVEIDGIRDRTVRLTPASSDLGSFIVAGDEGDEKLYYMAAFEDGYDLWSRNLRTRDTQVVNKTNAGETKLQLSKDGKTLFLLNDKAIKKMKVSDERVKAVNVSAKMKLDPAAEREAMYDFVVREERERFYDPAMHGVDWKAFSDNYRRFLPHINNNYDYAEMLSELLGELNVSHTGGRYSPPSAMEPSAKLGLFYDLDFKGPGLKVVEVIKGGPLDKSSSKVRPGHILTAVDGKVITDTTSLDELLKNTARRKTLLTLTDASTGKSYDEVVKPISAGAQSNLLYNRWVEKNRQLVDSLSGGRLAYVHLQSMSDDSFRTIFADLLGRFYNREAVVIDTRWNGGGRLHEDIEVLLSGEKYLDQVVHGVPSGQMASQRWTKPSIMLIGEANYSNAHGTPWLYKHRGLGKLVGAPVPGTMTSVNWQTLQDESLVFGIPVTGMRLLDGTYLENQQLEPDIYVVNDPAEIVKGNDAQIAAAVSELLRELDSKK